MRFSELSDCAGARAQVAWLLAEDAVLDEFTSLAPRPLAWEMARGVSEYVRNNGLKRVVVASVHEDIVAHLRPSWLFRPPSRRRAGRTTGKAPKPTGTCATAASCAERRSYAAAAPPRRNPNLYEPPRSRSRCGRRRTITTRRSRSTTSCGGVQGGAWCLRWWHGRPVGFTVQSGSARSVPVRATGASREHRVVILPDFQGVELGWQMSEVVAARHAEMGRRFMSITMHHTFGGGRDRSERWRPGRRTTPRTSTRPRTT